MTEPFFWLKTTHIVSATVLFGTGLGTAFQMWMAHRSADLPTIATVSRHVVIADFVFTTPAVLIQPVSGAVMISMTGVDPFADWLIAAYILYVVAGICWLPVVWLQIKVHDLARASLAGGHELPGAYYRYMHRWFLLGWPAFLAVIAIFALMVAKPEF